MRSCRAYRVYLRNKYTPHTNSCKVHKSGRDYTDRYHRNAGSLDSISKAHLLAA